MSAPRQRIHYLLAERHTASAPEFSRMLGVTEANVRHHLGVLARAGQVEVVGETPGGGRGRPVHRYMLTRAAQPHALGRLAGALLEDLGGGQRQTAGLARLAKRLAGEAEERRGPLTGRLTHAAERLTALGYESHWEAHTDGPQILLGRCPYAAIIDQHPELCRMDAQLLETLTGEAVEQTAKIARQPEGPAACVFALKRNK